MSRTGTSTADRIAALGPPPPSDLVVEPGEDEVERFRRDGYLVVDEITTVDELEWLRAVLEVIFADEDDPLAPVDRSGSDGDGAAPTLRQAFFPELRVPAILDTTYRRNAHRYAAALLGRDAGELTTWGHAILKPARVGREAPWHQDAGYWEPELDYEALACWLPLHDVTVDQGAMQFVPGSHHRGLVEHEHADAPEHNLLRAVGVADGDGVACPLPAGGATFHHFQTLHRTAPNTTDRDRWAFPMEYQRTPRPRPVPRSMPWVDERRAITGTPDPIIHVADGRVVPIPLPRPVEPRRRPHDVDARTGHAGRPSVHGRRTRVVRP